KTDFAMSRPIVVTACMVQSSESVAPRRPWHLRAGGGAVHSIITDQVQRNNESRYSITSSARATSAGGAARPRQGSATTLDYGRVGFRGTSEPGKSKESKNSSGTPK